MLKNKFAWDRLDEIIMIIIGFVFLIVLAQLNMPAESIMSMGGTLMAVIPIYVKSALERRNGNVNNSDVLPPNNNDPIVTSGGKGQRESVDPPKHHLRVGD